MKNMNLFYKKNNRGPSKISRTEISTENYTTVENLFDTKNGSEKESHKKDDSLKSKDTRAKEASKSFFEVTEMAKDSAGIGGNSLSRTEKSRIGKVKSTLKGSSETLIREIKEDKVMNKTLLDASDVGSSLLKSHFQDLKRFSNFKIISLDNLGGEALIEGAKELDSAIVVEKYYPGECKKTNSEELDISYTVGGVEKNKEPLLVTSVTIPVRKELKSEMIKKMAGLIFENKTKKSNNKGEIMSYINSEKLSNSEKAEVEACVANGLVLNTIFGDFKDESVKTSFINKGDKFYLTFYITKKASVAEKLMKKALSILKGRESSIANISVDAIRDMDEITIKGVSELLVDQNDKTTVIEQDAEKILEAVKFETVLTGETLKLFHESILIMKSEILLLKNKQLVTETASILQDQKDILKNITLNISSSLKELYSNEKSLTFEDVESHLKLLKIARAEFITILNFLSLISFIFNAAENDKLIEEIGLEKSAQRKFLSEALISKLKMHLENSKEF